MLCIKRGRPHKSRKAGGKNNKNSKGDLFKTKGIAFLGGGKKGGKKLVNPSETNFAWKGCSFTMVAPQSAQPAWQCVCPHSAGDHKSLVNKMTGCKRKRTFKDAEHEKLVIKRLKWRILPHDRFCARTAHQNFEFPDPAIDESKLG